MTALSQHVIDEIRGLPSRYPMPRSAVMPALDLAQEELGYLTPESIGDVARALDLDPGYVEGVATFYTLFHLQPIGKHRFYVCTNLSCTLRGANEIVDHVRETIGVTRSDEVSADGLFSVEEVECLGACEYAPMMRFDHEYHYELTPEKIDSLISARKGLPSPASAPAIDRQSARDRAVVDAPGAEGRGEGRLTPVAPPKKPRAPRKKKTDAG